LKNKDQLVLAFGLSEEALRDHLQKAAGEKISLALTDNSASMISARARDGVLRVRLHRIFLQSDAGLLDEIAAFIRGKKSKTPLIRAFIKRHRGALKSGKTRRTRLDPKGRHHDLSRLAGEVNVGYFEGRITAGITWGTRRNRRAVRLRTLGSYCSHTDTIRINPVLDKRSVPSYFIEFILYHEMLHADMGCEENGGRRSIHSAEFRRRERLFREYGRALLWEKEKGVF
jgi:hypothetical protein